MLQYIGARYVPIFYQNSLDPTSSEWEANVTYEPMTWVSLPNGYMYISKKTVPANIGTPAQNGEYWLEAGQYNAYIQSLQDQIDDMNDGTVTGSLQNQINTMKDGSVSGSLQDQINTNSSDISTNSSNIGNLAYLSTVDHSSLVHAINEVWTNDNKKEVNLANRKFLFVGDSYGDNSIVNPNWVDYTVQYLGLTGSQYTNACVTATGFIAGTTKFIDQIQNYAGDKTEITDIVVAGGLNDATFTTTGTDFNNLNNAIQSFANTARTQYPNAKLWIGFIGQALDNSPALPPGTKRYLHRIWADYSYNTEGARAGFNVMANVDKALCLNTLLFGADKAHPNNDGSRILGGAIAECLRGSGYTPYLPKTGIGLGVISGRSKIGAEDFSYTIDGNVLHIHYQGTVIMTCPDITSVSGGSWYQYAKMSSLYFNNPVIKEAEIVLKTNSGMMSYQGQIKFDGDTLYFRVNSFDPSTHTYYNITMDSSSSQVILYDIDFDTQTLFVN